MKLQISHSLDISTASILCVCDFKSSGYTNLETLFCSYLFGLQIISGLQNFDKDNVASVVTAADKVLLLILFSY